MASTKNMATSLFTIQYLRSVAVHPHEQLCTVVIDTLSCSKRKLGIWLRTTPAAKHLVVMIKTIIIKTSDNCAEELNMMLLWLWWGEGSNIINIHFSCINTGCDIFYCLSNVRRILQTHKKACVLLLPQRSYAVTESLTLLIQFKSIVLHTNVIQCACVEYQ